MSDAHQKARARYIRLLERSAKNADVEDTPDGAFSSELIEEGYLRGRAGPDQHGVLTRAVVTGITVKGRLFLETLKQQERESSWWSRAKKFGLLLIGFIFGILSHVLPDLFKALWGGR